MTPLYHVSQDGADFYMEEYETGTSAVVTYPAGVRDGDCDAAEVARAWFLALLNNWNVAATFD